MKKLEQGTYTSGLNPVLHLFWTAKISIAVIHNIYIPILQSCLWACKSKCWCWNSAKLFI